MRPSTFKTRSHAYWVFLFCTLAVQWACRDTHTNETERPPNVIVILTDDQGWGDLGMNGNTKIRTPHIDALAQQGAVVERFYVSPVCSPTRAEFLTGRYHVRSGVYSTSEGGERIDLDETTIAEHFKANGYATAAFGKWHSGTQGPYHPNNRGFEEFYGFTSGHWGNYFSPMLDHNGEIVTGNGFLPDDLTDHALEFIESHKDAPFFVYVPYNTPHSPMQVPDQWWDGVQDADLQTAHRYADEEDLQFTKAAYALCENIDWNVGRIHQKVKSLGLSERTIIVYLSDNGPNSHRFNGVLKGKKGATDEGGVRVPFIINWQGTIPAATRIDRIAGAIDILPTLADLAALPTPTEALDGMSLKPLLLDAAPEWEDRYLVTHWKNRVSLRDDRFLMAEDERLYDLGEDPGQRTDITAEQPEQWERMKAFKTQWMAEVLTELPKEALRSLPVGFGTLPTQLPARDAMPHGGIIRSNRWPNDSFLTGWTSLQDSISWDVEVLEPGTYEAVAYYTCKPQAIGSVLQLQFGNQQLQATITEAHDPPLIGHEKDRYPRQESYVKAFHPMVLGNIDLKADTNSLSLKSLEKTYDTIMDFRLLTLRKLE